MVGATQRGLTISDLNKMEVGALVDYCIEYNEQFEQTKSDKPKVRKAKQSDWDFFFG